MIKGNFIGAAIVAIIYTVYILQNPGAMHSKTALVVALVILNALTIVLLSFAVESRHIIRYRSQGRGGIHLIAPGDHLQKPGRIPHRTRKRADMVQRTGECRQSVARDAAIGRRDAGDSAERRRLPDRSAGIRTQRQHRGSLRHHRGGSAARSSRHPIERRRIPHRTERRVLVRGTHGELIAIGLAEDHAASLSSPDHRRRIVRRNVVGQQPRGAGSAQASGHDHVLDADGDSGKRPGSSPGGNLPVHSLGRGQRALWRKRQIRVGLRDFPLRRMTALREPALPRCIFSGAGPRGWNRWYVLARFIWRCSSGNAHRSITLGTSKYPPPAAGALPTAFAIA